MADHPSPVAAELSEARDLCALPDPVQLDLIRDEVPGRDPATAAMVAEKRGRGRPPNALNKRNAKFRDQLLAMAGGVHPGLALARSYAMPVEQLAALLGCDRATAYGFQVRAAAELMPYFESKLPTEIAVKRRHDVVVIMPTAGVASETIDAIAREVSEGMEEQIDWSTAEIADVLPSLSGEPSQDVSREAGG